MSPVDEVIKQIPRFREAAAGLRDLLLADLVMIGETPSPTFAEGDRAKIIVQRFMEGGLQDCTADEMSNGFGLLPGTDGGRCILLAVNADTLPTESKDQTIEVREDRLVGPFVGDNSLALAALTTLPILLDRLQIRLKSHVVLLASARALGRGNLEGIRHFLTHTPYNLSAGLCLESVQLGRLNYSCIGMCRGEINCRLPANYDWAQFGATGTIIPLGEIINRISHIAVPRRPLTTIILGAVRGGIAYNQIAREASLWLELRSESVELLAQLQAQIEDIVEDVAAHAGLQIKADLFAKRAPGGLEIGHPLVRHARMVLDVLGVPPNIYATTSQLVALRDLGLPALTLGLTTAERRNELDEIEESAAIAPLATGLAQTVAMLLAMDGGWTS